MDKLIIVNPRSMKSQMSYIHHLNYMALNTSIELHLICESAELKLLDKRISVIELSRKGNRLIFALELYRYAAKLIIEQKINWVLSSYGHFNSLLAFFLLKARYTGRWKGVMFYDLRSASVSGTLDKLQNRMYAFESCFYDQIIAVSRETSKKIFGYKRSLDCLILGVGGLSKKDYENDLSMQKKISQIRKQYQIDKKTFVLVYIGTLNRRELDDFIMKFEFDDENCVFFIIGDGDLNSEKKISDVVKRKGLSQIVFTLGRLPFNELPIYLQLANVGVAHAPPHEALTTQPYTKIQDYAAFQLLVLASDNLSNNQFINMAEVVFLSEYNSVNKLKSFVEMNRNTLYLQKMDATSWSELSTRLHDYLKKFTVEVL